MLKLSNSRKAEVMGEAMLWVLRIIILIFVIGAIVAFKSATVTKLTNTYNLEYDLAINRLLYSPASFIYVDPDTKRAYPSIIDSGKFNEATLNASLKNINKVLAMKLELYSTSGMYLQRIYFDKESYDIMEPLTSFSQYLSISQIRYAIYRERQPDGSLIIIPAFLNISIVTGEKSWIEGQPQ